MKLPCALVLITRIFVPVCGTMTLLDCATMFQYEFASLNSGTAGSDRLSKENCTRLFTLLLSVKVPTNGIESGSVGSRPNVASELWTRADHGDESEVLFGQVPVRISGSGCASTGSERPSPGCWLVLSFDSP